MLEIFVFQGNTKGFAKVRIIWSKTLGKGMCEFWSTPWKLNTLMKIRYLIFYSINFLFAFPFEVTKYNLTYFCCLCIFVNKVIFFHETLQFKEVTIFCYRR